MEVSTPGSAVRHDKLPAALGYQSMISKYDDKVQGFSMERTKEQTILDRLMLAHFLECYCKQVLTQVAISCNF